MHPPAFSATPPTPSPASRATASTPPSCPIPSTAPSSSTFPASTPTSPDRRFPVLYLHDGQNLFDERTAFLPGHPWHAHTTADRLTSEGAIEPLILVGIANTGLRRTAEYTPTPDPTHGGGEGDRYGRLLREEVKPFLDRTYRTRPEPEHTGLGGSSLGGLISLYLGLQSPDVFRKLAVMSPSLWWDRRSILSLIPTLIAAPRPPTAPHLARHGHRGGPAPSPRRRPALPDPHPPRLARPASISATSASPAPATTKTPGANASAMCLRFLYPDRPTNRRPSRRKDRLGLRKTLISAILRCWVVST